MYDTTTLPSNTDTISTRRRGKTPSFSSILLDSIYRSMDSDTGIDIPFSSNATHIHQPSTITTDSHTEYCSKTQSQDQRSSTSRTKTQITNYTTTATACNGMLYYSEKPVNLKRAIMIEHWIEKYQLEEEEEQQHRHSYDRHDNASGGARVYRENSVPNRTRKTVRSTTKGGSLTAPTTRSNSSSPESHFNSGYSTTTTTADTSSCFIPHIPLKIKTTFTHKSGQTSSSSPPPVQLRKARSTPTTSSCGSDSKFMARTKSRALKMYGDLKNGAKRQQKQNQYAISPGAKIASFLISIFAANKKRQHQTPNAAVSDSEVVARLGRRKPSHCSPSTTTTSSSCSSGSSFSRSCLSTKTAPSTFAGKMTTSTAVKSNRSVRFYSESVIVDEDLRHCGRKCLKNEEDEEVKRNLKEIRIRSLFDSAVESGEVGKDEVVSMHLEEEETGDGEESCASSDLFELNSLNSVGVVVVNDVGGTAITCEKELPVYGTTSLEQNRAIARGFIV